MIHPGRGALTGHNRKDESCPESVVVLVPVAEALRPRNVVVLREDDQYHPAGYEPVTLNPPIAPRLLNRTFNSPFLGSR